MLQYNNPLLDKDFLVKLNANKEREIYARIIALTFQETPVEQIEGRVTQGSINIDGASSLRRTCSLTLTAKDLNINDFYWGVKSKFKLEIGLKNTVDTENYPEVIWFPQGVYVITGFNTSYSTNNYLITISGKDKMCLLNGDLGGALPASIDFGVEEYYDADNNMTTFTKVPIQKIIREALHAYALEPYYNIVINDLDEVAVELLDYKGDTPLYLLKKVNTSEYINFTDDGSIPIKFAHGGSSEVFPLQDLEERGGYFDKRVELAPEAQANKASEIVFQDDDKKIIYTVAKVEYGETAGYRRTDLTYAGDLISNIGESITSILDKIKNMLGNYEYFYDLDGKFVFQRKKIYVGTVWNNIVKNIDETYIANALPTGELAYSFEGNQLITAFSNAPAIANLKNDYSIWGARKSAAGEDIPIHYRYAIDVKPTRYTTLAITEDDIKDHNEVYGSIAPLEPQESVTYTVEDYDWRELIYQMALDYFKYNQLDVYATRLAQANYDEEEPLYQYGTTGYEQYYTDLQGFWRQLYNSNPEPYYAEVFVKGDEDTFKYADPAGELIELYAQEKYDNVELNKQKKEDLLCLITVGDHQELHPWLDTIKIPEYLDETQYLEVEGDEANIKEDKYSIKFYIKNRQGEYKPVYWSTRLQYKKNEIYVKEDGQYKKILDSNEYGQLNDNLYYLVKDNKDFYSIFENKLKSLFWCESKQEYYRYLFKSTLDIAGNVVESGDQIKTPIKYRQKAFEYIVDPESNQLYWTLDLIENPAALNFWFDFLDAESELGQFSVPAVGDRSKAINDNDVTAIYFRQVPNLIFTTYEDYVNSDLGLNESGYNIVFYNSNLESMFNISNQGKSAQDVLEELLYNYSYCIESVTIQSIPIYTLQPNVKIAVKDQESKIDGEYVVNKISIPLTYNGVMSINATKAPVRIY